MHRPASAPVVSQPSPSVVAPKMPTLPHGLPPKPTFDMFLAPEPAKPVVSQVTAVPAAPASLETGSNHDVVMNRKAIRMANMSAAEALKAELHGLTPLGRNAAASVAATSAAPTPSTSAMEGVTTASEAETPSEPMPDAVETPQPEAANGTTADDDVDGAEVHIGVKRKADEIEADAEGEDDTDAAEDAPAVHIPKKSKTEEHDDIK